jgi:hypothetical protein
MKKAIRLPHTQVPITPDPKLVIDYTLLSLLQKLGKKGDFF